VSEVSQGPGWWQASDLKWYPPERHPNYEAPPPPELPPPSSWAQPQQPPARRSGAPCILAGVVAAVVVVLVVAGIGGYLMWPRPHASPTPTAQPSTSSTTAASPALPRIPPLPRFKAAPNLGDTCQYPASPDPASKSVTPPRSGQVPTEPAQVSASMVTNQGNIGLLLANNESPCTVNSFASLAQKKFFDGTQCHRLTASPTSSVLQCGDPTSDGTGEPGYQFANEYPTDQYSADDQELHEPVIYPRGTLAMANAGPNTNGSQFFMVYKNTQRPPEYTVFGTIDQAGLATLDKVAAAGVAGGGQDGKPAMNVTISSVRLD
jgi:peptidyl-prolyl cis-trans isomerase B (cyclophilin B)